MATSIKITPDELYSLNGYFYKQFWDMPTDKKSALWNIANAKNEIEHLLDILLECSIDESKQYIDELISYIYSVIVNRYYIYYKYDEHYGDEPMMSLSDEISSSEDAIYALMDKFHELYDNIREMHIVKDNIGAYMSCKDETDKSIKLSISSGSSTSSSNFISSSKCKLIVNMWLMRNCNWLHRLLNRFGVFDEKHEKLSTNIDVNGSLHNTEDNDAEYKLKSIVRSIVEFDSWGAYWSNDEYGSYFENIMQLCQNIVCLTIASHIDDNKFIIEED